MTIPGLPDQSRIRVAFRWLSMFPAAIFVAYVAWFSMSTIYKGIVSQYMGLDSNSFLGRFLFESITHVAMGYAYVIAAVQVAPSHKRGTCYVISLMGLLISGFLFLPALLKRDYWALLGTAALIVGLVIAVVSKTREPSRTHVTYEEHPRAGD